MRGGRRVAGSLAVVPCRLACGLAGEVMRLRICPLSLVPAS